MSDVESCRAAGLIHVIDRARTPFLKSRAAVFTTVPALWTSPDIAKHIHIHVFSLKQSRHNNSSSRMTLHRIGTTVSILPFFQPKSSFGPVLPTSENLLYGPPCRYTVKPQNCSQKSRYLSLPSLQQPHCLCRRIHPMP
jgi:hypothetical protein